MGAIPASVDYRRSSDPDVACSTCNYYEAGRCALFDAAVSPSHVCDRWEEIVVDVPIPAADHHNQVLLRADKRVIELEARMMRLIRPVIARAGAEAARWFTSDATDFSAATLANAADRRAVAGMSPSDLRDLVASMGIQASVGPSSTMVAVKPRPDEAAALAQDGGLDASDLHVTLAVLGQYDGNLSDLAAALARVAATHAPLEGKVGGVGHFADNGNGYPSILLPSVPGLVELRVAVTDALVSHALDFGREHGYQPHSTVDYADGAPAVPSPDSIGRPLHFDELLVVRGNSETVSLPLTGVAPLTADASGDPPGWVAPSGDELVDVAALAAALRARTDPIRLAVIETVMGESLAGSGISFDATNPFAARLLAQTGRWVTSIAETTRADVTAAVAAGYDQGLSIPNTAKLIRTTIRGSSEARAQTIARTELAGAVNGASLAATQILDGASPAGQGYRKVWMTAPGATFPRHEDYPDLDGQEVSLDELFSVGDDELQYPGDPDGDPGEVINCRCTMSYVDQAGNETAADVEGDG